MTLYVWPPISLSTIASPVSYNLDGTTTTVKNDTTDQLLSKGLPVSEIGLQMKDALAPITGSTINATPAVVKTFTANIKKMRITYNGGVQLTITKNATIVGYIAPGEKDTFDFKAKSGDTLSLSTASGSADGTLYLNFFGD